MRTVFLVLALGLGVCFQRAQAQTTAETMTFSIICQYVTNTYVTNLSLQTVTKTPHVLTVLLNSANLVKAMAIDMFGTKYTNWLGASIVYEQNAITGNTGIYMRLAGRQTNVSSFFFNEFSTNGFDDMFSHDVSSAFVGTNYCGTSTNSQLPLTGNGIFIGGPQVSDNLAYLTFTSTNTSFALFGFSEGTLLNIVYDREGDITKINKAQITGAGTFSLNVTTNYLRVTTTNAVPATNYQGLAHGTIYMTAPYHLDFGPPEGP